ncbi:hypothetical protein HPP92_000376 [Vanilla planifolia]|uniref:Uncharacterized protein n=1 Tax=Vanilla planifolia TaxID=51239 RepID=A0A835VGZ3_VANPL|nr:hypothetical protein HPP92_000376 [Vanilla planifolia]
MAKFELIVALCLLSSVAFVAATTTTLPSLSFRVASIVTLVVPDSRQMSPSTSQVNNLYLTSRFQLNDIIISWAKVKVDCTHFSTGKVEHSNSGLTDSTGTYTINVVDDHEDETCEVVLVESPLDKCKEIKVGRDRGQVVLTLDAGMSTNVRHANSLGFLRDEPLPICGKLLREFYGLAEEELNVL